MKSNGKGNEGLDEHGRAVAHFYTEAKNLPRVRLLHDLIFSMFTSGDWRDYTDGAGRHRWRECEFDYFLMANDINRDDAYGVFAYNRDGRRVAEAMMSDDPRKRRPLERAASEYQSAGPEGLLVTAKRLGWLSNRGAVLPAVPARARVLAQHGTTQDEQARKSRRKKIADQRDVLDACVEQIRKRFPDPTALRYIVDELRAGLAKRGRPEADHAQWRRDIEKFKGDSGALAKHWELSQSAARKRMRVTKIAI
jgi:hypothetical protein